MTDPIVHDAFKCAICVIVGWLLREYLPQVVMPHTVSELRRKEDGNAKRTG